MAESSLARVKDVVRREGLAGLGRRVARRLLRPLIRVEHVLFFETDLTRPLPAVNPGVPLDIRVVGQEDLEAFRADLDRVGLHRDEVRQRLEQGDLPLVATSGGSLAHIVWISFRAPELTEIGAALCLDPGVACAYGAVTLPEWRGKGVHPAASRAVREYERGRGYTRHVSWVVAGNRASLRTNDKLGHTLTNSVWAVQTMGMGRPMLLWGTRGGRPGLRRLP